MKKYRGKGRRNFATALTLHSVEPHGERRDADRKSGGPRYLLALPAAVARYFSCAFERDHAGAASRQRALQ
jgi:hypothetical protein